MENKNGHRGGNVFIWGLVTGAFITTLLTTKKGRQILHNLTDLGIELFEDFIEQKTRETNSRTETSNKDNLKESALENLASEITEEEAASADGAGEPKKREELSDDRIEASKEAEDKGGNGHSKKRLFKGIRRK